jgi:hypothetical protein
MTTSDLNTDVDLISRAIDWAEMYPRDPDSWADLRNKMVLLRFVGEDGANCHARP